MPIYFWLLSRKNVFNLHLVGIEAEKDPLQSPCSHFTSRIPLLSTTTWMHFSIEIEVRYYKLFSHDYKDCIQCRNVSTVLAKSQNPNPVSYANKPFFRYYCCAIQQAGGPYHYQNFFSCISEFYALLTQPFWVSSFIVFWLLAFTVHKWVSYQCRWRFFARTLHFFAIIRLRLSALLISDFFS